MKKIFRIFRRDVRATFTNYAALITILALCILPSLYAWFNIKASWDPYDQKSTSGIKVAVVNLDEGTELRGKEVNVGKQIVDELKKNKQLGWTFLNAEEARKALEREEIYASITITKDFSKSLTSIVTGDITKGTLIYTINEKMNAIAPKLTDKGVTSLQTMISQTVVETVSNTVFEIANEIGVNLKAELPKLTNAYNKLVEVQSRFGALNEMVSGASSSLERIDGVLGEIKTSLPGIIDQLNRVNAISADINNVLGQSQGAVDQFGPTIVNDLAILQSVAQQVQAALEGIEAMLVDNADKVPAVIDGLQEKLNHYIDMTNSMIQLFNHINGLAPDNPLGTQIGQLQEALNMLNTMSGLLSQAKAQLNETGQITKETLDQLISFSQGANAKIQGFSENLQSTILPKIQSILKNAIATSGQVQGTLTAVQEKIPTIESILGQANNSVGDGEKVVAYLKEHLPKAEAMVNDIIARIQQANTEEGLRELIDLLTQDMAARSDFLTNPVAVKEEVLFPMGNYGTSMSPFYTILSLWVGLLLLSSMLTVEAEGDYKSYQVYFGKFLTYGSIALIQALIVSLGDLYLLRINCKHPGLFVLGSLFSALVFTAIIYSLVSVLGNVGKVISIILLVLQVAGSGGTFPIQLTPRFFQVLNPFLPFTYGISFERQAIGGVVKEVISRDSWILLLYLVGFIVISLLIKKPMNHVVHRFAARFKESGLGE